MNADVRSSRLSSADVLHGDDHKLHGSITMHSISSISFIATSRTGSPGSARKIQNAAEAQFTIPRHLKQSRNASLAFITMCSSRLHNPVSRSTSFLLITLRGTLDNGWPSLRMNRQGTTSTYIKPPTHALLHLFSTSHNISPSPASLHRLSNSHSFNPVPPSLMLIHHTSIWLHAYSSGGTSGMLLPRHPLRATDIQHEMI